MYMCGYLCAWMQELMLWVGWIWATYATYMAYMGIQMGLGVGTKIPAWHFWRAGLHYDFLSPSNTEGKHDLGKLLQPDVFKGKNILPKKLPLHQGPSSHQGPNRLFKHHSVISRTFPQFSGQPKPGSEWALLIEGGEMLGQTLWTHVCLHALLLKLGGSTELPTPKLSPRPFLSFEKGCFSPLLNNQRTFWHLFWWGENEYSLITRT